MADSPIVVQSYALGRDVQATRRGLRKLGREYRRAIDKELKAAVAPIVADAKKRYRVLHPARRRRGRRSRGSQRAIRGGLRRGSPAVFLTGGERYPHMAGQEWGSNRWPQFPDRRPSETGRGSEGNFWWPAIEDGRDDARKRIIRAVDQANGRIFRGNLLGR